MIELLASILGPYFLRVEHRQKVKKCRKNLKYCEKTRVFTIKEQENLKKQEIWLDNEIAREQARLITLTAQGYPDTRQKENVYLENRREERSGMTIEAS